MSDLQPAPRVIAVVDDLFFAAKIRATAEATGREVMIVKSPEQLAGEIEKMTSSLVLLDLNSTRFDAIELIKTLKSSENSQIKVVGFVSHVQVELKHRAEEAGCDQVMPRSAFTQRLPDILAGDATAAVSEKKTY